MPNGKSKGDVSEIRSRVFRVLLYPDNPEHMLAIMELQSSDYPAVGIKHDKDVYTEDTDDHKAGEIEKEHFHFVLKFKNARYLTAVAKSLGIEERFIQTAKSYKGSVEYLLHINHPEKFQYDTTELLGFAKAEALRVLDDTPEDVKVLKIMDFISHYNGYLDVNRLTLFCCQNGLYSCLRRSGWICRDMIVEHNKKYFESTHK